MARWLENRRRQTAPAGYAESLDSIVRVTASASLKKNDWSRGAGEVDRIERRKPILSGKEEGRDHESDGVFQGVLRPLERLFVLGTFSGLSEGELRGSSATATRRPLARSWHATGQWSWASAGGCSIIRRTSKTRFSRRSSSLSKRRESLRDCELLGNWLYGVAVRVAMRGEAIACDGGRVSRQSAPIQPQFAIASAIIASCDRCWMLKSSGCQRSFGRRSSCATSTA